MAEDTATEEEVDAAPVEEEPLPSEPDVATLSKAHRKGEEGPVVLVGTWVQIGSGDDVPEEARGKIGVILESPWQNAPWTSFQDQQVRGYVEDPNVEEYLVKLRDETDAVVKVPLDGIEEFSESRAALQNFA